MRKETVDINSDMNVLSITQVMTTHKHHLFAMLLEVISRGNGCIFEHLCYLLYLLDGNIVIYHLVVIQGFRKYQKN